MLHGIYCLGCCWLLFVVLFPLGMNVGAMAAVTLIILAEKMLPWPRLMPHASRRGCRACALRCAGDCVIATPPHLQAKWQRGYAHRNADEDAREWQRTYHEVAGHTQLSSAIQEALQAMSAIGTKRTCRVTPHMSWG
ncbi:MAG: DUF2182 domain-containing protein [Pseudolabrys sp.]